MTGKIAIIDHRFPLLAKEELAKHFELIELPSSLETYQGISAHPDIFFCKTKDALVYAPNTDNAIITKLKSSGILLIQGILSVGKKYPETSKYNAVVSSNYIIHNLNYTDDSILNSNTNLIQINVNQGYTRCNLIEINSNLFLTSDLGIHKVLLKRKLNTFYINPLKITLPGFKNGFFGGCCGLFENKLFVTGSLNSLSEEIELKKTLKKNNIELVELCKGPLFDCGSILIL